MNYATLSRLVSQSENTPILDIVFQRALSSMTAGSVSPEEFDTLEHEITRKQWAIEG